MWAFPQETLLKLLGIYITIIFTFELPLGS